MRSGADDDLQPVIELEVFDWNGEGLRRDGRCDEQQQRWQAADRNRIRPS